MALAILAGALWGAAWGCGKYLLLWRPLLDTAAGGGASSPARVGVSTTVSLLLDVPVLLIPFLLRSRLPFPFAPCLIAAALALSACGRWPLLYRAWRQKDAPSEPNENDDTEDKEQERQI